MLHHTHRRIIQVTRPWSVQPWSGKHWFSLFADRPSSLHQPGRSTDKPASIMPKHSIVRDSVSLAKAMIAYLPDSDLDSYKVMLQTLRENPDIRPLVLAKLTEQLQLQSHKHLVSHPDNTTKESDSIEDIANTIPSGGNSNSSSSSNNAAEAALPSLAKPSSRHTTKWFDLWLKKALNSSRTNLFPLRIPHASDKKILERKARLAAYLFANKQILHSSFREFLLTEDPLQDFVTPNKDERIVYTEASKIADDLGNQLYTDKLAQVSRMVRQYVEGDVDEESFLLELSSICSLHMDLFSDLLTFLGIPMNRSFLMLIQSRKLRRQRLMDELQAELSYVIFTHSHMASRPAAPHTATHDHHHQQQQHSIAHQLADLDHELSTADDVLDVEQQQLALDAAMQTRRAKISFSASHVFEVTVRCFSKTNSTTDKYTIDANAKLYFESAIKNMRTAASAANTKEYENIAHSIREEYFEDAHQQHALHHGAMDADAMLRQQEELAEAQDELSIESYASSLRKIMIDNLPDNTTEADVRHALRNCGNVKKVWLFMTPPANPESVVESIFATNPITQTNQIVDLPDVSLLESLSVNHRKTKGIAMADELPLVDGVGDIIVPEEDLEEDEATQQLNKRIHDVRRKQRSFSYKRKIKSEVLKGNRTDNYAFVQMEDDAGFAKITCDAIRIFGINISRHSCRTYKVDNYRNFRVEVKDQLTIKEVHQAIGLALAGKHECYIVNKTNESSKPLFINLVFHNHTEAWKAFNTLLAASKEGMGFLNPSWVRTASYFTLGKKAKEAIESEHHHQEILEVIEKLKDDANVDAILANSDSSPAASK